MDDAILPEFQIVLRTRMLVPVPNVGFYTLWTSRYLAFLSGHSNLKGDLALADMKKVLALRSGHIGYIATDPVFDSLRQETRFRAILDRLHLAGVEPPAQL